MHKEGYLGIVWGIFLMCHFQHAAKFFPLCSCYYLEEQVEVIWQFDTQTVLHTHTSPIGFHSLWGFCTSAAFCMQ